MKGTVMIEIKTVIQLPAGTGKKIVDFLLNCDDVAYQNWWPGTHLAWHTKVQYPDYLGNIIFFDEYVGTRRLKLDAVVVKFKPDKEVVWQIKKFLMLPAWLEIRVDDRDDGTVLTHTLRAGYSGLGRIFDAIFILFLDNQFGNAMDEHARVEFNKLALRFD
jgi:hypothetical protein